MAAFPWFNGLLGAIKQDGDPVEMGAGLNFEAPLTAAINTSTGMVDVGVDLGAGAPVSLVQNEGVDMAARTKLNFRGFTVTDDAGSDRTNVDLTTSPPTSTGQLAIWSNALAKWTASRTLTGSYSVIGDLAVTSFVAVGASPATTGQLRAGSSFSLVGKTVAAADQILLSWGLAADVLALGTFGGAVAKIEALATTQIDLYVAAALQLRLTDIAADFQNDNIITTGFLALGTSPATGGLLRLQGATDVTWNLGGTPITALQVDGSGNFLVGRSGANGTTANIYDVKTGGSHSIRVAGAPMAVVALNALKLQDGQDANFAIQGNGEAMIGLNIAASGVRNLDLFGDGSADMNGGDGTIAIRACVTMPSGTSATTDCGQLVNHAGVLKWLGPDGTITPLAGR